jgi:hypothetical protein
VATKASDKLINTNTEHHPNNDLFEEVKFVTPFVPSSPLLELKQCPHGHQNIVLNSGLHSTVIFLGNRNIYAMDVLLSTPCPYEDSIHVLILVSKLFRRMVVDAYVYHKYCKSGGCVVVLTLQLER